VVPTQVPTAQDTVVELTEELPRASQVQVAVAAAEEAAAA
jgi:hypothetical protein